jgi:hypothetical protein
VVVTTLQAQGVPALIQAAQQVLHAHMKYLTLDVLKEHCLVDAALVLPLLGALDLIQEVHLELLVHTAFQTQPVLKELFLVDVV